MEWREEIALHMHLDDGILLVAMLENYPVGLISVYWMTLLTPLSETLKGYIDIINVQDNFRRMGIAKQLVKLYLEQSEKKMHNKSAPVVRLIRKKLC